MKKPALLMLIVLVAVFASRKAITFQPLTMVASNREAEILPKDQLWGEAFKYPYQVQSYELAAKIPNVCIRCRATAIASASGTPACTPASKAPMERTAVSA